MIRIKLLRLSAHENSPDYAQFLNLKLHPQNWEGYLVYIKELGSVVEPPFEQAKKWYFNENGEWHESPFIEV